MLLLFDIIKKNERPCALTIVCAEVPVASYCTLKRTNWDLALSLNPVSFR